MNKLFKHLAILLILILKGVSVDAQLVSYRLQESFTVAGLDSFFNNSGFSLPLSPQYPVDIYQIIYKTSYVEVDSMRTASGIIGIPRNSPCPMAMVSYHHGTFARRVEVPSYVGPERPISMFFAGVGGVVIVMPDELGLGDSDSTILIHPYMNAFHTSYASVNLMRAARQLQDTLNFQLNGEIALTGYSQGGYSTMATHKLIQDSFPNEFNLIASAPMSGAYDLNNTMINDVMLSDSVYATPGYLPYLLLGYHSVYADLRAVYPTPSDVFKYPYDSIIPPMFYAKTFSINDIQQFCNPVPKLMIKDSVLNDFINDNNHIFRQILRRNDLLGWAPRGPVKIHYCTEDEQVYYMNAIRADSAWRANGSTQIEIQNFGALNHGGCVQPSLTSAAFYILGKISTCTGIETNEKLNLKVYPNPAYGKIVITKDVGESLIQLHNLNGEKVFSGSSDQEWITLDVQQLPRGVYTLSIQDRNGNMAHRKLVLQ